MKKITTLLLFVVLLTSCSSDDSNGLAITEQNLLGKWYVKGGIINDGVFENYEHNCGTSKDFQEFFSNGTVSFNDYTTSCELNEAEFSNWELIGNKIIVSNTNFDPMIYQYEYAIVSLTSESLVLKQTLTEGGITTIVKSTFTRE